MNRWLWVLLCIDVVGVIIIVAVVTLAVLDKPRRDEERRQYLLQKQKEGSRAYRLHISADANPYRGARHFEPESMNWLEGYMDAKEHSTQ